MNCSASGMNPEQCEDVGVLERARLTLMLRKRRAQHFNRLIFNEPAWDVLLHLFIHEHEGVANSVATLADEAGISQSTMTRWLTVLTDEQLVKPGNCTAGGEATFAITERGRMSMTALFSF